MRDGGAFLTQAIVDSVYTGKIALTGSMVVAIIEVRKTIICL